VADDRALALVTLRPEITYLAFPVREGTAVVGRGADCDFIVAFHGVSRRHAEIVVRDGTILVRDLASRNGTFIDGDRIDEAPLTVGQQVKFGSVEFVLQTVKSSVVAGDDEETARLPQDAALSHRQKRDRLTVGQRRVYDLLIEGSDTEKEIGARLHLSPNTVHSHVRAIYAHFNVSSRAELIAQALSDGR
jgi:pSer/pThr/pTyr-binding forkhead associated (FHA) protein